MHTRNFHNDEHNVSVVITHEGNGATTGILGDDTKVTDDEIFEMFKGNLPAGWREVGNG
jgi:hypothetical protein